VASKDLYKVVPLPQPGAAPLAAPTAVEEQKKPADPSLIYEVLLTDLREVPKISAVPTKASTPTNSVAVAATIVGDEPVKALLTSMTVTGVNSVVVAVAMVRILAAFLKRAAANVNTGAEVGAVKSR